MSLRKYPYYLSSIGRLLTGIEQPGYTTRLFLGLAGPGPHSIRLRKRGLRFLARGPNDVWALKETFLDGFYERFGFRIEAGWNILDIGGGIGDFAIFAATAAPGTRVAAYEPTRESLALMQENLALNGLAQVLTYHEAVWSQAGELAIAASPVEPGRNRSKRPEDEGNQVTVRSVPLAEAIARLGPDGCQLLKVDCEGAEFDIFLETQSTVLDRVERIVMEYHDGVADQDHPALVAHFRACGFVVETFPNYVHDDIGYLRAWRDPG